MVGFLSKDGIELDEHKTIERANLGAILLISPAGISQFQVA
jgi:hypothetical protein